MVPDDNYGTFLSIIDEMQSVQRRIVGMPNNLIPTIAAFSYVANLYSTGKLICISDGSFNPKLGAGSHAWIMTDESQQYQMAGVGPVDGDPTTMSAYHPELHGILANLVILQCIRPTKFRRVLLLPWYAIMRLLRWSLIKLSPIAPM